MVGVLAELQCCALSAGPSCSVTVTGGLGALGSLVGSWAAAQGARHVTLLGRTASRPTSHNPSLDGLKVSNSLVTLAMCDVAAAGDWGALETAASGPRHIFHAGKKSSRM